MAVADVFAVFALWFGGMGAILLGSYGIAVWWQNRRERLNTPIPYLPITDDDIAGLHSAMYAETPLYDQVLEESDWRAWAEEMGASHD